MIDLYKHADECTSHKFINGWVSYKSHAGLAVKPGKQSQRFYPGQIIEEPQNIKLVQIKENIPQCPGCGARNSIFQNGKAICTYCKGELNGKF